jgi:Protein of unknown function (DUF3180)
VRPTRLPVLLALIVLSGALSYGLTSAFYADVPSPSAFAPISLLVLAMVEGYTAHATAGRLAGRARTRPIPALTVARFAAFAKATSPVAALFVGGYAGFLGYVSGATGSQTAADTRMAVTGVACAFVLLVSALALERVCRVKPPRGDDGAPADH